MRRSLVLCLLIGVCLAVSVAVSAAQPSRVSVTDYGAKGDGVTDNTAAFTAAMNAVAESGGIVDVPVGNYMIKTHISVPPNVTLQGIWSIPTAFSQMKGSTLLAVEGEGSETGAPFITLNLNSTIKGLTVYYPNQQPEKIVPYPWCVAGGGGDNASIVDCLLVNPYQAVDFGTHNSGRHYIRNLYGQPLRRGIFVDKCYDIGRIENVHFWPFWKWDEKSGIREWMWKNSEAFVFARTDWEYVLNTFVFGYKVGYRFIASKDGPCNGNFLGIGADAANIAVLVEDAQQAGLLITNGEFVAFAEDKPCEVVVADTCKGPVQFMNCAYWGPADQIARISGQSTVTFNGCNLNGWNRKNNNTPAIELTGGNLIATGCNFNGTGPQVSITGKAESAIITSNRMGGKMQISNAAKADLQVGLNVFDKGPQHPKEEAGAIVIDDADGPPAVKFSGDWLTVPGSIAGYFQGARWAYKGSGNAKAVFSASVRKTGRYRAYVFAGPDPQSDHASNAPVTVRFGNSTATKRVDMRSEKGRWIDLGSYLFKAGTSVSVTISNYADGNVLADAVKLVPVSH